MKLTVANWNVGGAKVLEAETKAARHAREKQINDELCAILGHERPTVATLQEVVAYKRPTDPRIVNIIDEERLKGLGYRCFYFPLFDSLGFSSQAKWRKIWDGRKENKPRGDRWDRSTFFSQGNAFLFRDDVELFPFWDLSKLGADSPGRRLKTIMARQRENPMEQMTRAEEEGFKDYLIEHVHLTESVYGGNRDSEPRAALVAHIIMPSTAKDDPRPIDVFVVNLHLVTLTKERVGIPEIDSRASRLRLRQLEQVFDKVISPYNSWYADRFPWRDKPVAEEEWETFDRHQPVWLLCGDFNFTENSDEYDYVMRRNFLDTTPPKKRTQIVAGEDGLVRHDGTKSKGSGNPATLTVDYVFAGPKFVALSPLIELGGIEHNYVDHEKSASDHFPVISTIPLHMVR